MNATFTRSEAAAAATITVKRSGLMTGTATVHYATADGSASSGSDYLPQSGDLTFGPGVVLRSFAVPIVRDALDENDETVLVQLSSPGNAALGPTAAAVLTIVDDDASGLLR